MGTPTLAAYDSANMKSEMLIPVFDGTVIVTMYGETTGVPTGTDQLVKLEIINGFIIKILGNRVAYIDR